MWFDIVCIVIILAGFVLGYKRGFLAQAGSVGGVILGIVFCNAFAERLSLRFISPDDSPESILLAKVMSYVIIFVICYIVGRMAGSTLASLTKALKIGFIDKLCGAVFTTFEYALVFSIILNAWIGAFPNTKLRSEHDGIKEFVVNLAPEVFGSPTVNEIFGKVKDMAAGFTESAADIPSDQAE